MPAQAPIVIAPSPALATFATGLDDFVDQIRLAPVAGADVASVMHLREEIDLSAHAGPQFGWLEKKETSAALSSRSTSRVSA